MGYKDLQLYRDRISNTIRVEVGVHRKRTEKFRVRIIERKKRALQHLQELVLDRKIVTPFHILE